MANLTLNTDNIKSKIYTIRNTQVMLDKYLAELYEVKAIRLREQVKRNNKRFPSDFMFRISLKEFDNLRSQFVTIKMDVELIKSIYLMYLLNKE